MPSWETPVPRKRGQSENSSRLCCDKRAGGGFCPSTGAAPDGAKLLCHPQHHPVCLCCSLQVGKMLCRCRCRSHFSSEHFGVALQASAAPGPSGPGCCHLTCGGPAQQELPVWDLSFAPLGDVCCISLLGKIKGICYLAIFYLSHNL